jgi:hypothetical protein
MSRFGCCSRRQDERKEHIGASTELRVSLVDQRLERENQALRDQLATLRQLDVRGSTSLVGALHTTSSGSLSQTFGEPPPSPRYGRPRKLTDIEIVELTPRIEAGAFWPGTTEVSCYSLSARALGKGAFGSVYSAVDLSAKNTVAIKVFSASFREDWARAVSVAHPSSRWETEGAPIDYLREARLLSQLRHPRIVELQRLFKAQPPSELAGERGAWCMVLGFCSGGSVSDFISTVLRHKPPQGEQVSNICASILYNGDLTFVRNRWVTFAN